MDFLVEALPWIGLAFAASVGKFLLSAYHQPSLNRPMILWTPLGWFVGAVPVGLGIWSALHLPVWGIILLLLFVPDIRVILRINAVRPAAESLNRSPQGNDEPSFSVIAHLGYSLCCLSLFVLLLLFPPSEPGAFRIWGILWLFYWAIPAIGTIESPPTKMGAIWCSVVSLLGLSQLGLAALLNYPPLVYTGMGMLVPAFPALLVTGLKAAWRRGNE